MSEILSREQLQDAERCYTGDKSCDDCKMRDYFFATDTDCRDELAKTALYWQDKCELLENDKINAEMNLEHLTELVERQAAVLEQARKEFKSMECTCYEKLSKEARTNISDDDLNDTGGRHEATIKIKIICRRCAALAAIEGVKE